MKIHIIGCSGSGKTYLANALSKKYNISHFDLDDIQWDNNAKEYGKKRTLDERNALLQEILYNNDEWIIEGVYYAWVQQCFDEADKIYVLDMPGYLYKSRIIIRSIKRKLGILKGKKETLKSVYNLLKWTETFQNKNLKEIRSILDRYDNKVIWLSRKKDVEKIIKRYARKKIYTILICNRLTSGFSECVITASVNSLSHFDIPNASCLYYMWCRMCLYWVLPLVI